MPGSSKETSGGMLRVGKCLHHLHQEDTSAPDVQRELGIRIANCYARRMAQLVTRVDDHLVEQIDALVAAGVVANRSEAVRLGLTSLIDHHRRRQLGMAIVEGYRTLPQTDEELAGLDDATRALIAEEPW